MSEQLVPTIGRIVRYRLCPEEAAAINRRRADARNARDEGGHGGPEGNIVAGGDEFPMMIARVYSTEPDSYVNGQVFLDGNDVLWATSVKPGDEPGQYAWPQRT
jgi:hypothetical protein